ncbi:magnesium transporter CorA family protein [Streptacidiphilus neutrinimicus]|uniref:magnesium transporter CorA family protein n=1 Tax=Streptacidiphilus neutrinimicus TaxID=105420 RepID=UPI000A4BC535|nr:magnesium transporter CorA family protein [Streptacidiphilus neutrinimicus]
MLRTSSEPESTAREEAATAPTAHTRLYRDGRLAQEGFPSRELPALLRDPDATVWLDLCGPTARDFAMLEEDLGLHPLAVEDARHEHQRPKLDRYAGHVFLSVYAVSPEGGSGPLETVEMSVFVTRNALITVRTDDRFDITAVLRRWDENADLAGEGVAFLLHGLLDHVVDGHFRAVQDLDDRIEELEDLLFDDGRAQIETVQRSSYALRKELTRLRRVVLPMREVVSGLLRPDLRVVGEPMLPYYRDVQDHVLRASEWTESLRDLVNSIMETNLTVQGNRMNLIMKKVTSWAAVIAVPTAITGFYGQNVPYPGFGSVAGFWTSTAAIVIVSVLLYAVFKRRDWI